MTATDPQTIAEAVIAKMARHDRLVAGLGITVVRVAPGSVGLQMTVADGHLNALDMCHGGVLFAFADVAFAMACNSRNENMVAANCSVSYLRAAALGDVLTVRARETLRAGRNGIYDAEITNGSGEILAVFRGQARAVPGTMLGQG